MNIKKPFSSRLKEYFGIAKPGLVVVEDYGPYIRRLVKEGSFTKAESQQYQYFWHKELFSKEPLGINHKCVLTFVERNPRQPRILRFVCKGCWKMYQCWLWG